MQGVRTQPRTQQPSRAAAPRTSQVPANQNGPPVRVSSSQVHTTRLVRGVRPHISRGAPSTRAEDLFDDNDDIIEPEDRRTQRNASHVDYEDEYDGDQVFDEIDQEHGPPTDTDSLGDTTTSFDDVYEDDNLETSQHNVSGASRIVTPAVNISKLPGSK